MIFPETPLGSIVIANEPNATGIVALPTKARESAWVGLKSATPVLPKIPLMETVNPPRVTLPVKSPAEFTETLSSPVFWLEAATLGAARSKPV